MRTALQIAASILASLGIASVTVVPYLATIARQHEWDTTGVVREEPTAWVRLPQWEEQDLATDEYVAGEPEEVEPAPEPEPEPVEAVVAAEVAPPEPEIVLAAVPNSEGAAIGVEVDLDDTDDDALADADTGLMWDTADPFADGVDPWEDGVADADVAGAGDEPRKAPKSKKRPRKAREKKEKKSKAAKVPCPDPVPDIILVEDGYWHVERGIVEYYATHLLELEKLGWVATHENDEGVADGFRVGLRRCSILHQAGLRHGDVVNSINGRTITTILQAIGAYFALRGETEIELAVTRKGAPIVLRYTLLQETREERRERHQEEREERRADRAARKEERVDGVAAGN